MVDVSEIVRPLAAGADDVALALTRPAPATPARSGNAKGKKPSPTQPGSDTPTLDLVENTANNWMMPAFVFSMAAPFAGGLLEKRGYARIAKAVKMPTEVTFGQIGDKLPLVGKITGGISQMGMNGLALFTDALHATGFTDWRSNAHLRKMQGHLERLSPQVEALKGLHGQMTHAGAKEAVGNVLAVLQEHPSAWDTGHGAAFRGTLDAATGALKEAGYTRSLSLLGDVEKFAGKAHVSHMLHDGYANLSHYTRNHAVKKMADTSVMHGTLQNGAFLFFGLASAYRTGHDLNKKMNAMRRMTAALTGQREENLSWMSVMLSGMPNKEAGAVMGAMRWGMLKEFGPAAVAEFANNAMNIRMTISEKLGNLGLMIAFNMASSMWRGVMGETIMPAYMALTETESRRELIPAAAIAGFLGEVVPELKVRGGANSQFAKALGEIYAHEHAAHKISVDGIVREIGSGRLLARIEELQKHHEQVEATNAGAHSHEHVPVQAAQGEGWRRHLRGKESDFHARTQRSVDPALTSTGVGR
ncbi:MAG: hypothetical protein JO089_02425 [Alphaproteobacteria bacterium]|nr:hypothetical protein [Alphaproteobacteria bacterium]